MATRRSLRRLLLIEAVLSFGGIAVAACMGIVSIVKQQHVTEALFADAYRATGVMLELRGDVLALRNAMFDFVLSRPSSPARINSTMRLIDGRMRAELADIRRGAAGDSGRINDIEQHLDAWAQARDQVVRVQMAGDHGEAQRLAMEVARLHVEAILADSDYLLEQVRNRATRLMDEGRTGFRNVMLAVLMLAGLAALAYVILSARVRKGIETLFGATEFHASHDALTGVHNRRTFIELAEQELERGRRYHCPVALLMLDLDNFKLVNDRHGHGAGDRVLEAMGGVFRKLLRKADVCGRIGGEEFGILLAHADLAEAGRIAERIRREVERTRLDDGDGELSFTVSVGAAAPAGEAETFAQLMGRADQALYESKRQGRNRVTVGEALAAGNGS